jgi:hypothetical protein
MRSEFLVMAMSGVLLGFALDARAGESPREVPFATADGGGVLASRSGSGTRGVVLAHGVTSVSVLGANMGGGASGRAATEAAPGEIDRLILFSPVSILDPGRIHAASVLDVASHDEKMAPGIREQSGRAPEPKRLVLLEGGAHAQNIFRTPEGGRLPSLILEALEDGTPSTRQE